MYTLVPALLIGISLLLGCNRRSGDEAAKPTATVPSVAPAPVAESTSGVTASRAGTPAAPPASQPSSLSNEPSAAPGDDEPATQSESAGLASGKPEPAGDEGNASESLETANGGAIEPYGPDAPQGAVPQAPDHGVPKSPGASGESGTAGPPAAPGVWDGGPRAGPGTIDRGTSRGGAGAGTTDTAVAPSHGAGTSDTAVIPSHGAGTSDTALAPPPPRVAPPHGRRPIAGTSDTALEMRSAMRPRVERAPRGTPIQPNVSALPRHPSAFARPLAPPQPTPGLAPITPQSSSLQRGEVRRVHLEGGVVYRVELSIRGPRLVAKARNGTPPAIERLPDSPGGTGSVFLVRPAADGDYDIQVVGAAGPAVVLKLVRGS